MLKPFYQNESDIPESVKGAYIAKNGRYELDELDTSHPVLEKNRELLTKNSTITTENQRLNSEVAKLEGKALPEGKIAVDKAEFDTLKTEAETAKAQRDAYAALGTIDELKPKVEGYDELKTQTRQAIRDKALMQAGVSDLDRARRFKSYDDLEIVTESKDGKEVFYRVTTDDKGTEVKTVFDGELLKSDGFKDDLGSLVSPSGTKFFRQGSGAPPAADTPVALAEGHMNKRYSGPAKATTT